MSQVKTKRLGKVMLNNATLQIKVIEIFIYCMN